MSGIFGGGGSSSSAPAAQPSATSQTQTVSNIAPWAQSGVSDLINAGMGQVFNTNPDGSINLNSMKGYTPFNANTPAGQEWVQGAAGSVAGFSPLQQQAQQNVANMQVPGQYGQAMDAATMSGLGSLGTTQQAGQYGQIGQAAGLAGMQAGNAYGQNATDPNAVAAYMNPYIQNALNPALQLQNQSFGQQNAANQGQATQQGAFGGGRQAVMQGLNQQNQMLAQNQLVGSAYNQAYNTANQNMQTAGQQAMQGADLGISGAQAGLAGVGAQQAGYGQLGAQGTNLANIAGAQTQQGLNINAAQQAAGATQQQNQQNILNQAMANYNTAQTYPMTQLGQLESMYVGAPQNITSSTYSAAPSTTSQLAGLGATGVAAAKLAGAKAGGSVKDIKKMAGGGQVAFDVGGAVASSLENMPDEQLQQVLKTSSSQTMRQEAAKILADRQTENAIAKGVGAAPVNMQMAGGGIVAFAGDSPAGSLVDVNGNPLQAEAKAATEAAEKKLTSQQKDIARDTAEYLEKKAAKSSIGTAAPSLMKRLGLGLGLGYTGYQLADTGKGFSEGAASALTGPEQSSRREMMMGDVGSDTSLASGILSNADYSKPVPSWVPDWLNPNKIGQEAAPKVIPGSPPGTEKPAAPAAKPGASTGGPGGPGSPSQSVLSGYEAEIKKRLGMMDEGLGNSKAQADLDALRKEIGAGKNDALWQALMMGGMKAMGGRSPWASVNIGEGGAEGVKSFAEAKKGEREDKKLLVAQQSALDQAEYARKTGNLNALIAAQTRLDQIKQHRDTLGAQYASIAATKEAQIDANMRKAYSDAYIKAYAATGGDEALATAAAQKAMQMGTKAGDIIQGYKFKGGNPNDKSNWEKA